MDFAPTAAARVAAMLRHAAIEAAAQSGRSPEWIARYVAGHAERDAERSARFSYLALPSVGDARGRIARVLLLEPPGSDGEPSRWATATLRRAALIEEGSRRPRARLTPVSLDPARDPEARALLGPARTWASLTPLVLPGHDDRRPERTRRLLERALQHAGWTGTIPELEWSERSRWGRVRPAGEYFTPDHLRSRPRVHLTLRCREPKLGPLALGAGRHAGLGWLGALADDACTRNGPGKNSS